MNILFPDKADEYFKPFFSRSQTYTYPPYNLIKMDNNSYRIEVACAGFAKEDLQVFVTSDVQKPDINGIYTKEKIVIRGKKGNSNSTFEDRRGYTLEEESSQFLHKGIAERKFELNFLLGPDYEVSDSQYDNGLLKVYVTKKPEAKTKPKEIPIR